MSAEIMATTDNTNFDLYDFKRKYFELSSKTHFERVVPIDHDTLVPVIYAITGTNKLSDCRIKGLYESIYDMNDDFYKDCIACIDYRDVKKVRESFIKAMLNGEDGFIINNISYVLKKDNGVSIPDNFLAKKEMLADVQNNLSTMIKQSIEKDNELGLMIVE
jgi:hypothetical protein